MSNQAPFPVISVEGDARERGYQYGQQAKSLINKAAESYHRIFQSVGMKANWEKIQDLAKKFERYIEEYDHEAIAEMRGMAEGSGVTFEDILIINTRTELLALQERPLEEPEGCTVLVATPEVTANHHMLMAQNFDMSPEARESVVIVKKKMKGDRPNTVAFHEAGMIVQRGFNSAGIVCFGNGLWDDKGVRPGVPVQVLVYGALSATNVAEAVSRCLPARRGKVNNKVIGSPGGLCVNIEIGIDYENFLLPENGILAHTNHLVTPVSGVRDLGPMLLPNTIARRWRALQLLNPERGKITVDTFKRVLTDHMDKPDSICAHVNPKAPFLKAQTNLSVIVDLTSMEVEIAKGPPCEHPWVHLDFKDIIK